MRNENNYCCITRAKESRLMGSKLSPRLPHDICNLISGDQPPLSHFHRPLGENSAGGRTRHTPQSFA